VSDRLIPARAVGPSPFDPKAASRLIWAIVWFGQVDLWDCRWDDLKASLDPAPVTLIPDMTHDRVSRVRRQACFCEGGAYHVDKCMHAIDLSAQKSFARASNLVFWPPETQCWPSRLARMAGPPGWPEWLALQAGQNGWPSRLAHRVELPSSAPMPCVAGSQ
jgi:hypothetical protein